MIVIGFIFIVIIVSLFQKKKKTTNKIYFEGDRRFLINTENVEEPWLNKKAISIFAKLRSTQ